MSTAREYHTAQVHYVRKGVSYSDLTSGTAFTVGTLPAGAVVLDACAVVTTAFNSATSDVLNIGTASDGDGFATSLDITSAGKKAADELATSDDLLFSAAANVTATWTGTGAAPSAGAVEVIVSFVVDNDN